MILCFVLQIVTLLSTLFIRYVAKYLHDEAGAKYLHDEAGAKYMHDEAGAKATFSEYCAFNNHFLYNILEMFSHNCVYCSYLQ